MSELRNAFRTVTGEGTPRLRVVKPANLYSSYGSPTYTATTVSEPASGTTAISTSATGGVVNSTSHGLSVGHRVRIAGHSGSTPDINGDWYVGKVNSSSQIVIDINITVGGTGGTIRRIPDFSRAKVGMAVVASVTRSSYPPLETYGRITAIDIPNLQLTLESGWNLGTPTNGNSYGINGWIIDLPMCQELVERFEPEELVHELWRRRKESRFYGYNYRAELNYQRRLSADTLYTLEPALNREEQDSLVLIPRMDKPGFEYNVLPDGDIELGLFGQAGGHRGVVLRFVGKELVPFPLRSIGYGFNYATNYGIGL